MVASDKVFIDSSFLIAFYNVADSLHQKAVSHGKSLVNQGAELVISNFIFLETVTVLSQRVGRESASKIGDSLLNPLYQMIYVDQSLHEQTWEIFQEVQSKNVSFVDCSILVCMRADGITKLATFDDDFKKLKKFHRFQMLS